MPLGSKRLDTILKIAYNIIYSELGKYIVKTIGSKGKGNAIQFLYMYMYCHYMLNI